MIIKGTSRAGAHALGQYLSHRGENERVATVEVRGTIDQTPAGALMEMDAYAVGTRCENSLYHAMISPEPPHRLTPDQRIEAIDALEAKLGLDGHARVVVVHEKEGREHIHVAWSRIDIDTMKAVPDSHNYRKHEEVARDLERRFGHDRVQGAHAERDGIERPDRTPSRAELRQEQKTGVNGREVKAEVTALFKASDGPEAFKAALEDRGYTLAQGDRRDFVIIDQAGGVHSLARRLDGMKAAELRSWMSSLDRASLPTADQAQASIRERADAFAHDQVVGFGEGSPELVSGKPEPTGLTWDPPNADGFELGSPSPSVQSMERPALQVADAATGAVGKLADVVADIFAEASEAPRDPAADQVARLIDQRHAAAALDNIRETLAAGRMISVEDIRNLAPEHLQSLRSKGDDYMRQIVMDLETERSSDRSYERDRDR